jgi:hypothetical protein
MSTLVPYLGTAAGKSAWASAVEKYTNTDATTVSTALAQLTPDMSMPLTQIEAVAQAMYEQKLIASPLSTKTITDAIDYTPLMTATGKTAAQLGGS